MRIAYIQRVDLTLQPGFRSEGLLQSPLQNFHLLFQRRSIYCRSDLCLNGFRKPGLIDHGGDDFGNCIVQFCLIYVQSETALMAGSGNGILAIVVIPCFLVPAMGFGDVAVHAFATAWTSQNAGQDVGMVWIVDLFPLKGIDLALFLCQIPIFF